MKTKREETPKVVPRKGTRTDPAARRTTRKPRGGDEPSRRAEAEGRGKAGAKTGTKTPNKAAAKGRRPADAPTRGGRPGNPKSAKISGPARESRGLQHGPPTTPFRSPAPAKNASQAKARAKARKAKAPKIVRVPLRERLLRRLTHLVETVELNPRTLLARVPFVVLVIGSLGVGLGVTLWLSTAAAERSYQLSHARDTNQALAQQKDALERDVLEAQAAPALAEAARNLGMIPSRDTAHLVQDPSGNWIVVGTPKPAEGVPPPPLNNKLPDDVAPPPRPAPPVPVNPLERSVPLSGMPVPAVPGAPGADPEVLVRTSPLGTAVAPGTTPPAVVPGLPVPGAPVPGVPATGGPALAPVDAGAVPVAPLAAPAPVLVSVPVAPAPVVVPPPADSVVPPAVVPPVAVPGPPA
jgi:hypothetical protein